MPASPVRQAIALITIRRLILADLDKPIFVSRPEDESPLVARTITLLLPLVAVMHFLMGKVMHLLLLLVLLLLLIVVANMPVVLVSRVIRVFAMQLVDNDGALHPARVCCLVARRHSRIGTVRISHMRAVLNLSRLLRSRAGNCRRMLVSRVVYTRAVSV